MTSAAIVSGLADLAEAAYINFGQVGLGGLDGNDLKAFFPTSTIGTSWPIARVDKFIQNWRVVAHQPDMTSGFSGTVFERINPKPGESRYVFAARGTAGLVDIVEDLGNLVANGIAWQQTIDMYNWWKELTTPFGVTYKKASFEPLTTVTPNFVIEGSQSFAIKLTDTIQQSMPRLSSGVSLDVTGHSLGGHLATAFSRLFGANTQNVVTINGAGYSVLGSASGNTDRLFSALGGGSVFPSGQILNIYGDRGPEIVTQNFGLQQPGDHRAARLEDFNYSNTLGHGSGQMSLSLALYDTLRRLQEGDSEAVSAATMLSAFHDYLRSGANDQYKDYEGLIDGMRRSILGDTQRTIVGDAQSFHSRLIELRNSSTFQALVGKLKFELVHDAAIAKTDFAAFMSLQAEAGFSLRLKNAADSASEAQLYATNRTVYEQWLSDKNLRSQNGDLTKLNFSDQWIADRAALLNAVIVRNTLDNTTGLIVDASAPSDRANVFQWYGADPLPGEILPRLANLTHQRQGNSGDNKQFFSFGDDGNNVITGTDETKFDDHLYGGAGNDTITAGKGDDYVEGNAGNDIIDGGEGNDRLIGGTGNDQLTGGKDSDILIGGEGNDELAAGKGNDVLYGGTGNDTLDGGDGNDFLNGGAGIDTLSGGDNNDYLVDQGGSDKTTLKGDGGNDILEVKGGSGITVLGGGAGNDILKGGSGSNSRRQLHREKAASRCRNAGSRRNPPRQAHCAGVFAVASSQGRARGG